MKDDLNAARGIIYGILLSLPLWLILIGLMTMFGAFCDK